MRSAEWQVAAASMDLAAASVGVVVFDQLRRADSDQLRWADSDQQALLGFVLLPADSDQLRASAHSARGLPAFHPLLQVREHSHRGLWYPATMSL
jgi:hypothetical protein